MSYTRYLPIGKAFDTSGFLNASADPWEVADIDDDPASPNTADYMVETGSATETDNIDVEIEPPTIDMDDTLLARINGQCSTVFGDAEVFSLQLLDADSVVAASYTGSNREFSTASFTNEFLLDLTPGSYNWASARLSIGISWIDATTVTIYALDLIVDHGSTDPDTGPGGQRGRNAAHHMVA